MTRFVVPRLVCMALVCALVFTPFWAQALAPLSESEKSSRFEETVSSVEEESAEETDPNLTEKERKIQIIHEKEGDSWKKSSGSEGVLIIHERKE